MATAPPPPSPASSGTNRTLITVVSLIGIVTAVICLALFARSTSPRRRLEELQLQNELRRSGYRERRKRPEANGIDPSLLQSIPAIRYQGSAIEGRGTRSLDLEKGHVEAETETWAFSQSLLNLETMRVEMSEVGHVPESKRSGRGDGRWVVESEEQECPICTEIFVDNECVRVLPCGHMHHQRCVDRWLLGFNGTCPVCRVDIGNFTLNSSRENELPQKPRPAVVNN